MIIQYHFVHMKYISIQNIFQIDYVRRIFVPIELQYAYFHIQKVN